MESPDCRPNNDAGACPASDDDRLSMVSDQELDQDSDQDSDEEWQGLRKRYSTDLISARGAQLAFTLPRELVNHVVDLIDGFDGPGWEDMARREQKIRDLGSWSLVCLDWAIKCRWVLHNAVKITSERSALRFRALVKGPCSDRLTPLLDIIRTLDVIADLSTDRSWHHLLTTIAPAVPAHKFGVLVIHASAYRSGARFGRSIHWGIPSAVSALPRPYRMLELHDLHLASLQSLFRVIQSLPRVEELVFADLTWDEDGAHALAENVTPGSQLRLPLARAEFNYCQDASLLLLHTLNLGCNPLQAIPPAEQSVIARLVECFKAVNTADGHRQFRYCEFKSSTRTSSQTGITSSQVMLLSNYRFVFLSFHYCQTTIGCTVLISRNEDESNTALNTLASHHLWSSLALFPNLRCLIVGLSDVDAVKVLAQTHQELWESLGKQLHFQHFASQPEAGSRKRWVGHNPVSLEQTDKKWGNYEEVNRSLDNKM